MKNHITKKIILQLALILSIDIALIALVIYYPHYVERAENDSSVGFCIYKNFLHIYCLTCGGTRAFGHVLSLDIISALKYNALVVLAFAYILFLNVYAVIALFKKKTSLILFRKSFIVYGFIILIAFLVVRNLLVYIAGFDPIGDILPHIKNT